MLGAEVWLVGTQLMMFAIALTVGGALGNG